MGDLLLDYAFKNEVVTPLTPASKTYLHKALCIVKPKGTPATEIVEVTSKTEVEDLTDDLGCLALFDAGLSSFYVLPKADLDVETLVNAKLDKFYTILVSNKYTQAEVTDRNLGTFAGVFSYQSDNQAYLENLASEKNVCGFYTEETNTLNQYWAFGKLLDAISWGNLQYIEMPENDDIVDLNIADVLFEKRISFVLYSDQYKERLAFFACGNRAIIAPYIFEEIRLDLQFYAVSYININQPQYTVAEASSIEEFLTTKVINKYVESGLIEGGSIEVSVEAGSNFLAQAVTQISEPTALWRIENKFYEGIVS